MKKALFGVWLAIGCTGSAGADAPPPSTDAGTVDARPAVDFSPLSATAEAERASLGADGAALVVMHEGRVVYAAGLGKKVGSDQPIKTSTLFRIASVTKPVTALAALRLVESGALSLDTKVTTSIPEFALAGAPPAVADITLRHLLMHTSGVGDGAPNTDGLEPADDGMLARWIVSDSFRKSYPLNFAPGATFDYSNNGYAVASRMIEVAAKKTFGRYVREAVLEPLGIKRFYETSEAVIADGDYTVGLGGSGAPVEPASDWNPVHVGSGGAGPWYASADDLAKLGQTIVEGGGPIATMLETLVNTDEPWIEARYHGHRHGLGLAVYDGVVVDEQYYTERIVGHEGGIRGFASMVYTVPAQQLVFVALANHSGAYFDKTFGHAMKLAGLPAATAMPPRGVDPALYPQLVGTYHDEFLFGDMIVKQVSGKLYVDIPSGKLSDLELVPKHGTQFDCPDIRAGAWFDPTITFVFDRGGPRLMRNRFWVAGR